MTTYARLQNNAVAEFLTTSQDITQLFSPGLTWVDVTGNATVQVGWVRQSDGSFASPPPPTIPNGAAVAVVSLSNLQAQLSALQAMLTALTNAAGGNSGG